MHITATHIAYYQVCHRKLWLFQQGITMEHTSDMVAEGKQIGEYSYPQRAERYTEISISLPLPQGILAHAKIDFYDAKNHVVHEVKKSDKLEPAHVGQVRFYLFLLEGNGVEAPSGVLEYPRLRQTTPVPPLAPEDRDEVQQWILETAGLIAQPDCPPRINKPFCKTCSYYEFCYVDE
jgi:CRISPR-associated exonuclease Cas4